MSEQPPASPDESNPQPDEADAPELETSKPSPAEDALYAWFSEQRTKSVDNLEAAARQIIALCTTLLGVLLGLLSLAKDPLPVYLDAITVRLIAGLGALALFAALATALSVVFPRRTSVTLNDPKSVQRAFERLLGRKEGALQSASVLFGIAMFCLVLVIGAAIFRTAPVDVEVCQTAAASWWCTLHDLFQAFAG